MNNKSYKIRITGRVQGVGFRPHVYRLACERGLCGYINNSVNGVEIEISGVHSAVDDFVNALKNFPPPLAVIESFQADAMEFKYFSKFEIQTSDSTDLSVKSVFVSPDLGICADCAREIMDKKDRRYGYAFTNCTNCGPRYTITRKLPYDRPVTTMAEFKMCAKCRAEYEDPLDRRFHAQPNACPDCGPGLALAGDLADVAQPGKLSFSTDTAAVIKRAAQLINAGKIGALMGLGGFHIACRADSDETVALLRERKKRPSKPFALMAPSLEWIKKFCTVSAEEEKLLLSPLAPIVLLRKKNAAEGVEPGVESGDFSICELIAPENNYLGFMLPYTPMHLILMSHTGMPLVMTSANLTDEPICYRLEDAAEKLCGICDFAMAHNREILIPCDDSVCFVEREKVFTVRPSRGIAPLVTAIGGINPPVKTCLAVGAILKNTVSFNLDDKILTSQYIGDTDNLENHSLLVSTADRFKELYNLAPDAFACDMHPGSNAGSYAEALAGENKAELVPVGHHYAHALSVMAENNLSGPLIALSFDGTGFGEDGTVWGGEFLICDTRKCRRAAFFEPFKVSNYDGAVKNVARLAFCAASDFFKGEDEIVNSFFSDFDLPLGETEKRVILKALAGGVNTVKTSSLGRIFDAAAALAGFNRPVTFEGEAAIWLEMKISDKLKMGAARDLGSDVYGYRIAESEGALLIDWKGILRGIIADRKKGAAAETISYKFHRSVIKAVYETAVLLSKRYNINGICLSGGVFYNRVLLSGLLESFAGNGSQNGDGNFLNVYLPGRISFGDSAISAGQCYYAMNKLL
ncbi:MAG TPA: carbamoyltransferase HypF [Candidatus Wallbacteria bacterium]|nr:carbamoyltransferase HypF [Candidatus Wallbacteria bacterium]